MADRPHKQLAAFGNRVRLLRVERGLSQEGLALSVGINRAYLSGVELGKRNVGLINVFKIAKALGVSAPELFER